MRLFLLLTILVSFNAKAQEIEIKVNKANDPPGSDSFFLNLNITVINNSNMVIGIPASNECVSNLPLDSHIKFGFRLRRWCSKKPITCEFFCHSPLDRKQNTLNILSQTTVVASIPSCLKRGKRYRLEIYMYPVNAESNEKLGEVKSKPFIFQF